jgi:hypothetical protein
MADGQSDRLLLDEVQEGARALALLARDEETFRAAVDAFRTQDGTSLQALLTGVGLGERCEFVCHWLRSKECVLLCLELSGPPSLEQDAPDVREFAAVVARVAGERELLEQVALAIEARDPGAWSALVRRYELERFSHLLCHWACTVYFRLVCGVVCQPSAIERRTELLPELLAAAQAVSRLAADDASFAASVVAVKANDCEGLRAVLSDAGLTSIDRFVCEWFCGWRCMLVCLDLCRTFPLEAPESGIAEMLAFARATGKLADEQGALERLSAATLRGDTTAVQALAAKLEFEPFCVQFCHWVCFLRCQLFCVCVSPPQSIGVFTCIGGLAYATEVNSQGREKGVPVNVAPAPANSGNGLTVAESRAFFNTLRLNGSLVPAEGAPLIDYRFETIQTSDDGEQLETSWTPVTPAQIAPTPIGFFFKLIPLPPFVETIDVWVNGGPEPATPGLDKTQTAFNIIADPEGWIAVPPLEPTSPMVPSSGWTFSASGDTTGLLEFDTTKLTAFPPTDESGVNAGESANTGGAGNPLLQTDVHYGIRMMIRDQGTTGEGTNAGTCGHIAINNTRYFNISHHPYWEGGLWNKEPATDDEIAVCSLGIAELASAPCSLLRKALTVQFTAAHSNLGEVSIVLEGPGGPYEFALDEEPGSTAGENLFGTATPTITGPTAAHPGVPWSFEKLPPCAYLLRLEVDVLLTTGDTDITPQPLVDYIAFCKGAS